MTKATYMQLGIIRAVTLWNTICGYLNILENEAGYLETDGSALYVSNVSVEPHRVVLYGDQESFKT